MNPKITKFNYITGKPPLGAIEDNKELVWKQLKEQAERVLEEAKELVKACEEQDIKEVLDGFVDVWYTNEYVEDLLVACGVDTKTAKHEICNNNDQKYTTSFALAEDTRLGYLDIATPTVISEVDYGGETYFTVMRVEDNKVMKLKGHVPPNLDKCIPKEWKK